MADDPSDFSDIDRSRALLAESDEALREALAAFAILKERLLADETVPPTELAKALTSISQNRGRVTDDMRKHEDRILFNTKRVAHAPLDFDQLRFEIGSTLDRIRTTLGPGEVSEEFDR
ncbi:MAG: hypothetical protein AAFY31_10930 [Pseudomonadota bacterium]